MRIALVLPLVVLVACNASAPAPVTPEALQEPEPAKSMARRPRVGVPQVSSELGEIDASATEKVFKSLQDALVGCHQQGLLRVPFEEGDIAFLVRVGADGAARWTQVVSSTLGDRATEMCMVQVTKGASWPRPVGGEAEVRKSFGFEAPNVRPPVPWKPERVARTALEHANEVDTCKGGAKGTFSITAYVASEKKSGVVSAVGGAPPSHEHDDALDCLLMNVRSWNMPTPGSYPAKITFSL